MKITAVNNNYKTKNNNLNTKYQQNINFRGLSDSLIGFWNFVDKSRAIQFTFEDMLGTNFPRTYKGAKAGYKYTGKINIPALAQEAIREFLTGPTMTLAPVAILYTLKKLWGESANTHRENIVNLSYIADTLKDKKPSKEAFEKDFLKSVVEDMLLKTTGKVDEEHAETLINRINEQKNLLANAKTRKDKKLAKASFGEIEKLFERIIKEDKADFNGVNFSTAKYSIAEDKVGATSFKNYISYAQAYIKDYIKRNAKGDVVDLSTDTIAAFKKNWLGKRAITCASMIVLTGYIMSFIPKLYTLASGKSNPNGEGVYVEAKKREGK